jgi:hypothetical protein
MKLYLIPNTVKELVFFDTNFRVFYKSSDPRVLEFVVLNVTDNYQWKNCIFLDICFRGLSGPHNQRKLEPHN